MYPKVFTSFQAKKSLETFAEPRNLLSGDCFIKLQVQCCKIVLSKLGRYCLSDLRRLLLRHWHLYDKPWSSLDKEESLCQTYKQAWPFLILDNCGKGKLITYLKSFMLLVPHSIFFKMHFVIE